MATVLRTLGEVRLDIGRRSLGAEYDLVFAVVLVVAAARPGRVTRQALCELLWPEIPYRRAGHNLRQNAYTLKRRGLALASTTADLALPAGVVFDLDERLASDPDLLAEDAPCAFLPGYAPAISAPFTQWLEQWRDVTHQRIVAHLVRGIRRAKTRSRWGRAAALGRSVIDLDPLNEEATLTVAEAMALAGSKTEAIAMLDRYTEQMEGKPGDLKLQAAILRKRIAERLPVYRSEAEGPPIFIGREGLMETIGSHVRNSRTGVGTVAGIWGEPGIGKTRLLQELVAEATLDGWTTMILPCQPSWHDRPLAALEQMTSALLTRPGALGIDPEALKTLRRLSRIDADDEPLPESPAQVEVLQARLRMAVLDLVDAVSGERPLVVAFDDVQWMDAVSTQLISMVVEHSATKRVALLFASRAQDQLPLAVTGRSGALTARVAALREPEMLRLLGALVRRHGAPEKPELLARAVEVANGNPLYAHTLVEHWVNTGNTSDLPPTLEVLIEQRLDALTTLSLHCLHACSLLGRSATVSRVQLALEISPMDLLASLDALDQAGLVGCSADGKLSVRHALVDAGSRRRSSKAAAIVLHTRIAYVLEQDASKEEDVALAWDASLHLRAAGEDKRADDGIERRARDLVAVGQPQAARVLLEQLSGLSDNAHRKSTVLALLADALRASGDWGAYATARRASLSAAGKTAEEASRDPSVLFADLALQRASPHGFAKAITHSRDVSVEPGDRARAALIALINADNRCDREAFTTAHSQLAVLEGLPGTLLPRTQGRLISEAVSGNFAAALEAAAQLLDLLEHEGNVSELPQALRSQATVQRFQGDRQAALRSLARALTVARTFGMSHESWLTLLLRAAILMDIGDFAAAEASLSEMQAELGVETNALRLELFTICRVRYAFECGFVDLQDARAKLAQLHHYSLPNPRVRTERAAGMLAISLVLLGERDVPALTDELSVALERTMSWGLQDYAVAVALTALSYGSRLTEAKALAARYLGSARLEASAPAECLHRAIAALG